MQYNTALTHRLYPHDQSNPRKAFSIYLMNMIYKVFIRRKTQGLDTTRENRKPDNRWHVQEHISQPLVEFAKGGSFIHFDEKHGDDESKYLHILMERIEAYTQISNNIAEITRMIFEDSIVPDATCINMQGRGGFFEAVKHNLEHLQRGFIPYTQNIAKEFVTYTLLFASEQAREDGDIGKDFFILKRMAEIIRGNLHLDIALFLHQMTEELGYLQSVQPPLYHAQPPKFKTNLEDSLIGAFSLLYHKVHTNEATRASNWSDQMDNEDSDKSTEPLDDPSTRRESDYSHASDDANIPDFVRLTPKNYAVNRFEGDALENSDTSRAQHPYFPVQDVQDNEARSDREMINAAKRNAQHEYYRQMTNDGTDGVNTNLSDPSNTFSKEFIRAEERLSEIRGRVMQKYISSHDSVTDPALVPIKVNEYSDYAIELGVYLHTSDNKIEPVLNKPMKKTIVRQTHDIFDEFTDKQSLSLIPKIIELAKFGEEWALPQDTQDSKRHIDIRASINPDEIIGNVWRHIIHDNGTLKRYGDKTMKLESNYGNWDNTAREGVMELDCTFFRYKGLTASFQIARNMPRFTHREVFQSAFTLKKSNLDFSKHMQKCFFNFIDLKVRLVTSSNQNIELVWTIHKNTPDHFHLMHMAYKSRDPTQTLLTPPINLSLVTLSANDILDETVGVKQHKIKDESVYKADEVKLMQLHAQGVKACTETGIGNITSDKDSKSFGFIYTYDFWTLIGTCIPINDKSANEYLTCYTIIHRCSDFAPNKERKRLRAAEGVERAGGVERERVPPQAVHSRAFHVPIARHVRKIPRGDNWLIFGIIDKNGTEMYYFIQAPVQSTRILLDQTTRLFQSKIYKIFYPDTITASERGGISLTEYISNRLVVELETQQISSVPGMFALWMRQHPKGQRSDPNEVVNGLYTTAPQYWTHLWDEFLRQNNITPWKSNLLKRDRDERLEKFELLYAKKEIPPDTRQGQEAQRGAFGGGGFRGRGGGFRGRGGGFQGRGRGGRGGRGGRTSSQYDPYTDQTHPAFPLAEESPQISEMQHEIDTLRRSLNQLALLQA